MVSRSEARLFALAWAILTFFTYWQPRGSKRTDASGGNSFRRHLNSLDICNGQNLLLASYYYLPAWQEDLCSVLACSLRPNSLS
ncbi:hypothetical protein DFH08DRAFT_349847 [Mycena albidolilacea]|uniref:Uncharacterized protein n=1 Tax=Mycena albidolilacea TaxID=1033008 RepID=A0AAD6ZIN2_9AGAR|nr:hypothetical protein DFH08DRAFT_349847 [Mycena albidolilacea]